MKDNNLTLGVVAIGDLLLEHKIVKTNASSIENIELHIPEYQRPYKWTARNAIQLLDDIIEARNNNKETYRVGTLILHKETIQDKDTGILKDIYNIVDGQQRLITFTLLLMKLIEATDGGRSSLLTKLNFLDQNIFADEHTKHNIPNNLNAFHRRVCKTAGKNPAFEQHKFNMQRLFDYIKTQCELIIVITSSQSEAFQFFDSQNARGKSLYPHDLLKAYHLREMADVDVTKTEKIVADWEKVPQSELNNFFGEYIYRLKEWMNGNEAFELNEQNIHKFKGITKQSRNPYAQFYKSAYSYAQMVNSSTMPFVSGSREITAFQLNAPIIAGEPFFNFTRYYLDLLHDIQDNSKYEGFYIQDNEIVALLDKHFKHGKGNMITRLLFDTALLLYVDRFCPPTYPSPLDIELFEQFVVFAFIWAYSLRAQHASLGWRSAQKYILGTPDKFNSFNLYKLINESDSPAAILSTLADRLSSIPKNSLSHKKNKYDAKMVKDKNMENIPSYMYFFITNNFYSE